ncbi:hypothetical protein BDN72DRAFT_739278, partial [Pluteus cervinus]
LSEEEMAMLRAFALKVEDHLADKTFAKFKYAFPESNVESLKKTKTRVAFLAAFRPVKYDCCLNVCICYTGEYEQEEACPICKTSRYNESGKPRRVFTYLPIIPRLAAYFKNPELVQKMTYRHTFKDNDDGAVSDVFSSSNYTKLRARKVTTGNTTHNHRFFQGERDIALGLSTDGFAPFKKRKHTC